MQKMVVSALEKMNVTNAVNSTGETTTPAVKPDVKALQGILKRGTKQ